MLFEVGETVVYPHHGAATISEVKTRVIKGEEKIYLKLRVTQGDLTIEVTNAGEVIPRHKLAGLFHPFARGSKGPQDGLGLGLYIASEIAKAHGGTLDASSTDEATIFTARLPCRPMGQSEEAA